MIFKSHKSRSRHRCSYAYPMISVVYLCMAIGVFEFHISMCQRNLDGTVRNRTKTHQRSLASQRESTSVAMKLTALLFALVFVALTAGN